MLWPQTAFSLLFDQLLEEETDANGYCCKSVVTHITDEFFISLRECHAEGVLS